jgi:Tfp pilus assembly protein PilF/peroxiredoxin
MYQGRWALLNFWATWCPPCREELRDLRSHREDLKDLGATILAISVDDPSDRAKVREYARQEELPFPILLADEDVIAAYNLVNRFLFDKIRDLAVPTSMLLDRDGNIVKIYRGRVPARQIIRDIQNTPRSEEELVRAAFPFPGQTFGMEFVRDYTVIADAFRRAGLNDQAADYYQHQLLEQGHDTPQSWNSLGLLHEREGKLDQAREAYEKALRLNPDYADSHNNLGAIHLKAGEIDKAVDSYRTAGRLAPWSADVQNNLGHALVEKGLFGEAIRAYRRAHEIDGQAPQPLINLGNTYLKMKRFQDAISAYGKVLQIVPDSADIHHNMGFAYLESGRLDDALASFDSALRLRPQYASAYNNKGTVFLRKGRFEEAGRAFKGAIQADSDFRPAYINLSMTHLRANEIEKAVEVLRRLLKVNPDDPMALDLLAQIEQVKSSAP